MTRPAEVSNDPEWVPAGTPATLSSSLIREPPWAAEIGALFLATAQRLATEEQFRLTIPRKRRFCGQATAQNALRRPRSRFLAKQRRD